MNDQNTTSASTHAQHRTQTNVGAVEKRAQARGLLDSHAVEERRPSVAALNAWFMLAGCLDGRLQDLVGTYTDGDAVDGPSVGAHTRHRMLPIVRDQRTKSPSAERNAS